MIIQNRDGSLVEDGFQPCLAERRCNDYYAAVPSSALDEEEGLIDRLINLAFDYLDARRVTVRVTDYDR